MRFSSHVYVWEVGGGDACARVLRSGSPVPVGHILCSLQETLWVLAFFAEVLFPDFFGTLAGVLVDNQVLEWMLGQLSPGMTSRLEVWMCVHVRYAPS